VTVARPSYAEATAGFDWSAVLRDLGWHDRDARADRCMNP
jgi:hypothetical protein